MSVKLQQLEPHANKASKKARIIPLSNFISERMEVLDLPPFTLSFSPRESERVCSYCLEGHARVIKRSDQSYQEGG